MKIKAEQSYLENNVELHLEEAANGWIVRGCSSKGRDDVEYVFKSLKEVKNNLESIYSVLTQDPKPVTQDDLDNEEKRVGEMKEEE